MMADDEAIDHIFAGKLDNLPPVSSKIVRIFTSSTFTDTSTERNTLMEEVYPKIKEYCREKHGLEFQVVDMRWGVRDEATDDHMTTELCMKEIENCQRLSMGPNFVVFLGQKYGYRPIPTIIVASELATMRDALVAANMDPFLLDKWYKKDSNAVPPVCILQPISSILINFNNKRVPKLQAQDQAIWWDTMSKMQKMLRKAAQNLYNEKKMDKEAMHNYFMSVTEREVIRGILNVKNTKNHCLAYVRFINNINLSNIKSASKFIDIINRAVDAEAMDLLADLRDNRMPARIEASNLCKYTVEWIGKEGLDIETHGEYIEQFTAHFYKYIVKLVDRAIRKEDSSPQGQIITELLQHLHTCNNTVRVFHGREEELQRLMHYVVNDVNKPFLLYGAGGCGKTSMIAKGASMVLEWCRSTSSSKSNIVNVKPMIVVRFVGTTPDSSSLAPLLISICKQIAYNYMLSMEGLPEDLVPLAAHLKTLLHHAKPAQPLLLFLDSVDQISGVDTANKLSWIPVNLPPNVKFVVSCTDDEDGKAPDLLTLQKMIDFEENFLEISSLGENLAINVIKLWMQEAHRDLNNYQWRVVQNAIHKCTLPIFVKLVFAEICRWKSYSRPQETQLTSTISDSIMKLFDRIELQHGKILVFHALAYITASKSGLSESELEDLISLDDKVLDDIYQYHLPPVRRIPPLLWTRIRNDLPNYLSEREADGVSVMNWYHRQFKDAAKERYFKNLNMATYFHSSISDYFSGIWGGGKAKPFRFTEVQRHRFGLTAKEGEADRKVPLQPLVFLNREGKVARYNLRQFGELPYHLIRSHRFDDLYENVLFNYEWLHSKLSSCPLQAVLNDFQDAYEHCDDPEAKREILLVADAMRLSGSVIGEYPDMLAPQLVGRLLPEMHHNRHLKILLQQCDHIGPQKCALLPTYHSMHTPGGPLKYSLEGHQFAVFALCLSSDRRYAVSVSNRLVMWDLSTGDIARNINPEVEGIMQALAVSPSNRTAVAFTSNNQIVVFNLLTGEARTLDSHSIKLKGDNGRVHGVTVSDTHIVVWGHSDWNVLNVSGEFVSKHAAESTVTGGGKKHILLVDFVSLDTYDIVYSCAESENDLWLQTVEDGLALDTLYFRAAMIKNDARDKLFACCGCRRMDHDDNDEVNRCDNSANVTCTHLRLFSKRDGRWVDQKEIYRVSDEQILQLKLQGGGGGGNCKGGLGEQEDDQQFLIATVTTGFKVWKLATNTMNEYPLPNGVRNISSKPMQSNVATVSRGAVYVVAGVRKVLYVWDAVSEELMKCLDAHFARIISMVPIVDDASIGASNSVITSSMDRTVKVWNVDNIFEQVHTIDRHEMPINALFISSKTNRVATVTRSCVGIWNIRTGKLVSQLADSQLGAIVTHATITSNGYYAVSIECDNFIVWDVDDARMLFKCPQKNVKQLRVLDDDTRVLVNCRDTTTTTTTGASSSSAAGRCICFVRCIPSGSLVYNFEYSPKVFRPIVITMDGNSLVALSSERTKDCLLVYQAQTGILQQKILTKYPNMKEILQLVALPHKCNQVALIDPDKGNMIDLKYRKFVRSIPRWNGICTRDGKYGLVAPSRGGLELIELRYGHTVRTFIPRVAEGVFRVQVMFTKNDDYILYYHSGRQTIRLFRVSDATLIANYRLTTELNAIACADDGVCLVLGMVDGCVTGLIIMDPARPELQEHLSLMPSRCIQTMTRNSSNDKSKQFKAAAHLQAAVGIMSVATTPSEHDQVEVVQD